jgi:hypothetical protein
MAVKGVNSLAQAIICATAERRAAYVKKWPVHFAVTGSLEHLLETSISERADAKWLQ